MVATLTSLLAVLWRTESNIQQDHTSARSRYQAQATVEFTISWDRATDLWNEYASLVGHQWQVGDISFLFSFLSVSFFFPGAFFPVILVI